MIISPTHYIYYFFFPQSSLECYIQMFSINVIGFKSVMKTDKIRKALSVLRNLNLNLKTLEKFKIIGIFACG